MATLTVFSEAGDGRTESSGTNHATVLAGSALTSRTDRADEDIGQAFFTPTYLIDTIYWGFDTSALGASATVSAAVLEGWLLTDLSTTDFTANARLYDYATLTTADYQTPSQLAALTLLATLASSGIGAAGAYKAFTDVAFPANVNKTGVTRLLLSSSRVESSTTPTTDERLTFYMADQGGGTTNDPKLTITYTTGGGDQTVSPDAIALSVTPITPITSQQVDPAAITFSISPLAPSADQALAPSAIALASSPIAPSVLGGASLNLLSARSFELNDLVYEFGYSGTVTVSSAQARTGVYSMRCNPIASLGLLYEYIANGDTSDVTFYIQVAIYIASAPSAINSFLALNNTALAILGRVRLDTDRTLKLVGNTTTFGSPSAAIPLNEWHVVGLAVRHNTSTGYMELEGRLDGVAFASTLTDSDSGGVGGIAIVRVGVGSTCTADLYVDDVIFATDQNGGQWPTPDMRVGISRPEGTGDSAGWVRGGTDSGANWSQMDELPPNDATDYVESSTIDAEDLYVMSSPIGLADIIYVVTVEGVFASTDVDTDPTFVFELEKTTGGTKLQSADIIMASTSWRVNNPSATGPRFPPIIAKADPDGGGWTPTTIVSMQAGVKIVNDPGVGFARLTALWSYIVYIPQGNIVSPDAISLALALAAPQTNLEVDPTAIALALAIAQPGTLLELTPDAIALALTLSGPQTNQELSPEIIALALALQSPDFLTGQTVIIPALGLGLVPSDPLVQSPQNVSPDSIPIVLDLAPAGGSQIGSLVAPPAIPFVLTLQSPDGRLQLDPPSLPLALGLVEPQVSPDQTIGPTPVALTTALQAPQIAQEVQAVLLSLATVLGAPALALRVDPPAIGLAAALLAFLTQSPQSVSPGPVTLTITPLALSGIVRPINPPVIQLVINQYWPTLDQVLTEIQAALAMVHKLTWSLLINWDRLGTTWYDHSARMVRAGGTAGMDIVTLDPEIEEWVFEVENADYVFSPTSDDSAIYPLTQGFRQPVRFDYYWDGLGRRAHTGQLFGLTPEEAVATILSETGPNQAEISAATVTAYAPIGNISTMDVATALMVAAGFTDGTDFDFDSGGVLLEFAGGKNLNLLEHITYLAQVEGTPLLFDENGKLCFWTRSHYDSVIATPEITLTTESHLHAPPYRRTSPEGLWNKIEVLFDFNSDYSVGDNLVLYNSMNPSNPNEVNGVFINNGYLAQTYSEVTLTYGIGTGDPGGANDDVRNRYWPIYVPPEFPGAFIAAGTANPNSNFSGTPRSVAIGGNPGTGGTIYIESVTHIGSTFRLRVWNVSSDLADAYLRFRLIGGPSAAPNEGYSAENAASIARYDLRKFSLSNPYKPINGTDSLNVPTRILARTQNPMEKVQFTIDAIPKLRIGMVIRLIDTSVVGVTVDQKLLVVKLSTSISKGGAIMTVTGVVP